MLAVDGNSGTRWSSRFSDKQNIRVDLGSTTTFDRVELNWEGAYGKSFKIQTSENGSSWRTVYATTSGTGGNQSLTGLNATGRYVRMLGSERGTPYGYSLYEFGVYSS